MALLRAASANFDVLITVDRNFPFQQNIGSFPIAVLILIAQGITYSDLKPGLLTQSGELQRYIPRFAGLLKVETSNSKLETAARHALNSKLRTRNSKPPPGGVRHRHFRLRFRCHILADLPIITDSAEIVGLLRVALIGRAQIFS
jgi:hypothetical protein